MARNKSIILTPAEKKAVVADLKMKIKAAKDADKAVQAKRKAAEKAHAAFVKGSDKEIAVSAKTLTSLNAQLNALVNPVPPAL